MPQKYHTIYQNCEGSYTEKGSRFLAFGYPLTNESQIRNLKESLRKQHHKAVHVVYASRTGFAGEKERSSDDGEPSGSAGKPVLHVLKKYDITFYALFVVRYFGGKKLGVPGLIHAYTTACNNAIVCTNIETIYIIDFYKITCTAAILPAVMHTMNQCGVRIQDMEIAGEICTFICSFEKRHAETVIPKIKLHWQVTMEFIKSQ
jgi:putative IMPACT (imprinted ancient) family translation regulator